MSVQQIEIDAQRATAILLEGFDVEPDSIIAAKIRQAYLLGRVDQASQAFDEMVNRFRGNNVESNLRDSITLARIGKQ